MSADLGPILGVLLAGGLSRRMGGGDKGMKSLGGVPLLARVIDRITPQVDQLILNANGDVDRFSAFKLPVVPDVIGDFAGPLAGVLTGMDWAATHRPDVSWIATVPTDAPFLPVNLIARLKGALVAQGADLARADSNGQAHPVVGLWPVRLRDVLRRAMVDEDLRKILLWTDRFNLARVEFDFITIDGIADPVDPFFNINRPGDVDEARRLLDASL